MTIGAVPICQFCKHFKLEKGLPCDAYPDGVPDEILVGGFDHRQPFKDDKGIRFEVIPGKEADLKKWLELRGLQ